MLRHSFPCDNTKTGSELKLCRQNYEALNAVHLMQTDTDLQPVMGAVHLLNPASDFSDKHFMLDVDADINEGQKTMVERSRRGPFREQKGASTIMDRSAHVMYRKRGGAFEITVRRGISAFELDTLIGKLGAHRMSTVKTHLFFIDGKKKKLGLLDHVSLEKLRDKIHSALDKRRQIGIELCDEKDRGIMHKASGHKRGMKAFVRSGQLQDALT